MIVHKNMRTALATLATVTLLGTAIAEMFKYNQTEATTARFDAQRTGWVPTDYFIAPDKMGEFQLQWKRKIMGTPITNGALSGAVVANAGLGITLAYLGTADNRTVAIDMDNGYVFYDRSYTKPPTSGTACLSASLATPTKPTNLSPAPAPAPTPSGQAKVGPNTQLPYGSVMGEPGEGIPPVKPGSYFATKGSFFGAPDAKPYDGTQESAKDGAAYVANYAGSGNRPRGPVSADGGTPPPGPGVAPSPGPGLAPAPGQPVGGTGVAARPRVNFGPRGGGPTYALSADGVLHALTTKDGLDEQQPVPFLPAGAEATDLILVNGILYTSTMNGCGGAPNAVWAIQTAAVPAGGTFPKPLSWSTGGSASPSAIAFNADGIAYVSVGSGTGGVSDAVVSLDPKTLQQKEIFSQKGADFATSPVIFREGKRDFIAAQTADGRVFLLDGADLSKPLFVSQADGKSGSYKPHAMATWKDDSGQRWLITTTASSVKAWKVSLSDSGVSLAQGWTLNDLKAPLAPLVVHGVVFALSSGDASMKSAAILYAVDGITGKTLWNSGKTLTTHVPQSSAIWNSMGQILIGTADDTVYAFGMAMERHL